MSTRTLKITRPDVAGMNYDALECAFRVLAREVERGSIPGAVAAVGRRGSIAGFRSYGWAQAVEKRRLMQMDSLFDLASLTKVVATLPSVLRLIDAGFVRLDDPVKKFFPEWNVPRAERVRVRHLLTHTAGLAPHRKFYAKEALGADTGEAGADLRAELFGTLVEREPGTRVVYSDIGFLMLQAIVEKTVGMDLAAYSRKHLFEPLGMKDTLYVPAPERGARAVATEYRKELGRVLVGEVHDENARFMGGIAGHAGLFSTAHDLCVFCQMVLNRGEYAKARVLSSAGIETSMRNYSPAGQEARGLGWAKRGPEFCSCGDYMSDKTVYHTGFTGTALYIDPEHDLFIVLLTNRVHPSRDNDSIHHIRPRFCNAVMAAVE